MARRLRPAVVISHLDAVAAEEAQMVLRSTVAAGAALGAVAFAGRKVLKRRNPIDLTGKVVLITGGSRGLGFALGQELAAQGARLAICARDPNPLEEARRQLSEGGAEVLATVCDVADRVEVQSWVDQALAHFGRIDVLINNAGVISVGPLEEQTLADFEEAMDIMY